MFSRSARRLYTQHAPKSRHAAWYSDTVPGMLPVALLGSTIYLALQLVRTNLSHEQYLEDARARVKELESRLEDLQQDKVTAPTTQNNVKRFWLF